MAYPTSMDSCFRLEPPERAWDDAGTSLFSGMPLDKRFSATTHFPEWNDAVRKESHMATSRLLGRTERANHAKSATPIETKGEKENPLNRVLLFER